MIKIIRFRFRVKVHFRLPTPSLAALLCSPRASSVPLSMLLGLLVLNRPCSLARTKVVINNLKCRVNVIPTHGAVYTYGHDDRFGCSYIALGEAHDRSLALAGTLKAYLTAHSARKLPPIQATGSRESRIVYRMGGAGGNSSNAKPRWGCR